MADNSTFFGGSSDDYFDCSTLSIAYASNGLATISFTVYKSKNTGPPYVPGSPGFQIEAGGVKFKGYVLEQSLVPASDTERDQWSVSAVAIGCKGKNLLTCQ